MLKRVVQYYQEIGRPDEAGAWEKALTEPNTPASAASNVISQEAQSKR